MGFAKDRRPSLNRGRRDIMPANVTSTGTILRAPNVYAIPAPAADATFQIGAPKRGAELKVFVATNSTKVVVLQTQSSAHTFFGSTNDRLTLSTGVGGLVITAVGVSTSQWALETNSIAGPAKAASTVGGVVATASASTR